MSQTRHTARGPIFRSALYLQKPVPSHRQHVVVDGFQRESQKLLHSSFQTQSS